MSHDPESELPTADRISDVSDQASATEEKTLAYSLQQARLKSKRQQEVQNDGTYRVTDCDECGLEIGPERLAVAVMNLMCIDCASARERRMKR